MSCFLAESMFSSLFPKGIKVGVRKYLGRTNSVPNSVKGTSMWG